MDLKKESFIVDSYTKAPFYGQVGFTCSAFDLLHAGHILMLRDAKRVCNRLIVGLQTNPSLDRPTKNVPVQSLYERYVQLQAVRYVDDIIVYETEKDLENILLTIDIDVRILGEEYRDKDFTGKDICTNRGIQLHYNQRSHSFSSTELRKRIKTV